MPKVCYSLLFNQSLCMGLKLAIVVFSFQLGHISIFRAYTNLLVAYIRFGGTMSRHVWIWRRFIQCKGIFLTCCKPPIISKNSGLHSDRPVHQTHRTPERQSRIRTQPWYHTTHQTQPNAAPKTQDAPDAAPKTQDTPDAAPNTQDATWRST